jgi:hypothetical protein
VEGGWVVILQGHDSADRIRLLVQGDHYLPVAGDNVLVAARPSQFGDVRLVLTGVNGRLFDLGSPDGEALLPET